MADVVDVDAMPQVDDPCPDKECSGKLKTMHHGDGCSCHIRPPCAYCVETTLECPVCGLELI